MDPARFALAVPDDDQLLARLTAALTTQSGPPIIVRRSPTAIVSFECATWDAILRSRVMDALETAVGPDWQNVVRPVE